MSGLLASVATDEAVPLLLATPPIEVGCLVGEDEALRIVVALDSQEKPPAIFPLIPPSEGVRVTSGGLAAACAGVGGGS